MVAIEGVGSGDGFSLQENRRNDAPAVRQMAKRFLLIITIEESLKINLKK